MLRFEVLVLVFGVASIVENPIAITALSKWICLRNARNVIEDYGLDSSGLLTDMNSQSPCGYKLKVVFNNMKADRYCYVSHYVT